MKNLLLPALLVASSLVWPAGADPLWTLASDDSHLHYVSIKSNAVGEINRFDSLGGEVSEDGTVRVTVDLASVETFNELRNDRMQEHVFGAEGAMAVVTAEVDLAALDALAVAGTATLPTTATLAFLGQEIVLDARLIVARLGDDRVMVSTGAPLLLSTEELGIDPAIDVLQEIAGLESITRVAPITLQLVFDRVGAEPVAATSVAPLLAAAGDPAAGERAFSTCSVCHVIDGVSNEYGPHLDGVLGRTAGDLTDYDYSDALKASGIVWSAETLAEFLADPQAVVPGTKMYNYVEDEKTLKDIVAYITSLEDKSGE